MIGRLGRSPRRAPAAGLPAAGRGPHPPAGDATCRTGSGCAPSPRWRAAACSACPTPTSCPPRRATATSSRTPTTSLRFKAAYVVRRRTAAGTGSRPARAEVAEDLVAVRHRATSPPAPARPGAGGRRPQQPSEPAVAGWTFCVDRLRGHGPAGAPGVAAAAGRPADVWTSCCHRWWTDPAARSPPGRATSGSAAGVPVGLVDRPARAAPRPARGRPGRRRRQRGRRRCAAERQEHAAAHADLRAGADPHRRARCSSTASTSAAAAWPRWPGCRTSAASPAGSTATG